MDCSVIAGELLAYHFGTIDDRAREEIDAHLVACKGCLVAYLALKRQVERGATLRPSDAMKKRLRDDVESAFRPKTGARLRGWFARPIPLYQGLAAAAVLVLLATVVPLVAKRADVRAPAQPRSEERIDTARPGAESLTFY